MPHRVVRFLALVALMIGASASIATAQNYPTKPVRLIVPAAAGGGTDQYARFVANYLGNSLGQKFVVENVGGAGGNLGVDMVAKAAPDGYTLCLISVGNVAINPFVTKDLPFDPLKDFEPIASIANSPQAIAVPKDLPAQTLSEFVAIAKKDPGKLNYANAGPGMQMATEMFTQMAGIQLTGIPYRGAAPALVDVIAGRTHVIFVGLGGVRELALSNQLKILAIGQQRRAQSAPDIPTTAEAGFPEYEFSTWFGLVGPRSTPTPIVELLNKQLASMLDDPAYKKLLLEGGAEPMRELPSQFKDRIIADHARYGRLVAQIGIKPE